MPIPDPWGHLSAAIGISAPTMCFDAALRIEALALLRRTAVRIGKTWWHHASPKATAKKGPL
jgi:DNA-binding IclR family transcriptional regulator